MHVFAQGQHVTYSDLFRWSARFSGVILWVAWIGFAIAELARSNGRTISIDSSYQAAALTVVFIGYAVGWGEELLGALFALFGTAAYFLIVLLTANAAPGIEAAWFAAPGVLYLLAWQFNRHNVHVHSSWH
jgi:hypothetical protein